ncbi:MAG: LLM class flavin-dependent oxidoreductase [Chloroflexi bacterium]|nr:LLM class flavin-dependent oxidoreductase [Chloroflexota bacterium]
MERIGLTARGAEGGLQELTVLAQRAEELGYESLWLGESWGRDLFTQLTVLAVKTSRLRLGSGIVNVFSRTPSLVAMTAASLDELSGRRFILGIGTSGQVVIENWHGAPFRSPLQRTREFIDVVKLALSGQRVDYQGNVFHLRNFRLAFQPPRADLPVFVAAMGPENLRLTGELADGCIAFLPSRRNVDYYRKELAAGAARKGRSPKVIELAPYIFTAVSSDGAQAKALVRAHMAYYIGGMGVYYNNLVRRYGYVEEAEAIQKAWQARDRERAASLVTPAMLDDLGIAGTPAECRQKLEDYRAAGVTLPIISFVHGTTAQMADEGLKALAPGR